MENIKFLDVSKFEEDFGAFEEDTVEESAMEEMQELDFNAMEAPDEDYSRF